MRFILTYLIIASTTLKITTAQNKLKVDSTLEVFHSDTVSLYGKFLSARSIGHDHPDFSIALDYSKIALNIAQDLNRPLLVAFAYEEIGLNQRLLGNKTQSIEATLKALQIFESHEEFSFLAASYAQLGANFVDDEEWKSAIEYFSKTYHIYEDDGNGLNQALTLINLGEAYRLSNKLDSAVFNFRLALSLNDSLNNQIVEGYARGNLGMALRSKGELSQAKAELIAANKILTELGDPYSVSVYTADLAQISITEGKLSLAERQLLQAYKMALKEGLKEQIRDFSEMLTDFYESQEDYKQALAYQKVFQVYQDSLVNKANIQQTEQLKANYQINKREREIEFLGRINTEQRNFNIALGVGILTFGMLAITLYQSNRQKNEANAMLAKQQIMVTKREEEKALLLKELNHRVKNNLQMVSSLLSLQENQLQGHPAAEAINAGRSRVEALSLIHQKLYQDDAQTTINMKDYLEQLVSNLLYSFGNPLQPEMNIEVEEMDIDIAIPISLIINELVTNALKYAYTGIAHPALSISLYAPENYYELRIGDNGIGMEKEKSKANSFGLKLVRSLVKQLNGRLDMEDSPLDGTIWLLTLETSNSKTENLWQAG